jgi:hypothetical protein
MGCKLPEAESHVAKAAAGGAGLFDGLGGRRLIHHMSRSAYFPKLAVASLVVNKFGLLGVRRCATETVTVTGYLRFLAGSPSWSRRRRCTHSFFKICAKSPELRSWAFFLTFLWEPSARNLAPRFYHAKQISCGEQFRVVHAVH